LPSRTRKPFNPSNRQSENPLDLVRTDLCGPMQTKSAGGAKYVITFIDDFSGCGTVQLLRSKEQAMQALEAYISCVVNQLGKKVKKIQSDRGGEYWNAEVKTFCQSKEILHQKTNPYSSQKNGVAERLNRTLIDKVRAMLFESGLRKKWGGEAVLTASYVRNRTTTKTHGKTPLELFFGQKPNVKELRVFGSKAYVHTPAQKRKKLDAAAKAGVFLGYEPGTKGYRILLMADQKTVVISRDVTFDESEQKDFEGTVVWKDSGKTPLQSVSPERVEPEGERRTEVQGTEAEQTQNRSKPQNRSRRRRAEPAEPMKRTDQWTER
jgi:transposase InsO family protein